MATRLSISVMAMAGLLTLHAFGQNAEDELLTRRFKMESASAGHLQQILQKQFANAGINFPENAFGVTALPTNKAMFVNERTGELTVRATRGDLQRIEAIIRQLQQPPIVQLESRYVEARASALPIPFQNPPRGLTNVNVMIEQQAREILRKYEEAAGVDVLTAPVITTVSGRRARLAVEQSRPEIYQDPPKLPRDTSPDADPTPRSQRRLPFPPNFERVPKG